MILLTGTASYGSRERPFVAGVFAEEADAHSFRQRAREAGRRELTFEARADLSYPFYLLEGINGIALQALPPPAASSTVVAFANSPHPPGDEDGVFFNLYLIEDDFVPALPGTDYMGALPHVHVTARTLAKLGSRGLHAVFAQQ